MATMLVNLNLSQNEIQNAVIQPLATAPANPKLGQIYFNSNDGYIYYYDGTNWVTDGKRYVLPEATDTTLGGVKYGTKATTNMTLPIGKNSSGKMAADASIGTRSVRIGGNVLDNIVQDESYVHTDNNYTTTEKNKLGGIASGAQVNVMEGVSVNGTDAPISNKKAAITVPVAAGSTDTPKMDGTAAVGSSAKFAKADHVHPTDTSRAAQSALNTLDGRVSTIEGKISTSATPTNKLVSESEMGDAIAAVEAKQLYANATQGQFATRAALLAATTFYNADGTVATPTRNDVAYVLADEEHDGKSAKYVIAAVSDSTITWGFVIAFTDLQLTDARMEALDSGITQTKREGYDTHVGSTSNPHGVTKAQVGLGNVDNTSDATKKTNFTGSVASGNTGFATGGDVYAAIQGAKVKTATGTIATSAKTATVSYTGTVLNAFAKDASGHMVIVDVTFGASSVTFTCAQNPSTAITCTVVYVA